MWFLLLLFISSDCLINIYPDVNMNEEIFMLSLNVIMIAG